MTSHDKISFVPKKWGGHLTGFRGDISKGSGVVFEVRSALGLSQTEMAADLGYSSAAAIKKIEARGGVPKSPIQQERLRKIARPIPEKILSPEAREWLKSK